MFLFVHPFIFIPFMCKFWIRVIVCVTKLDTPVTSCDRKQLVPNFTGYMWRVMICSILLASTIDRKVERFIRRLNLGSPYDKTQSSPGLWCAKKRQTHAHCMVTNICGSTILLLSVNF